MIFKIGSTEAGDYSNRVIAGTYDVNKTDVYDSWEDSNRVEHRIFIRQRVEGTFDMFFKDLTEYETFVNLIESTKVNGMKVLCTVATNKPVDTVTAYFFIDFTPIRDRKGDWSDYMQRFPVTIKEE